MKSIQLLTLAIATLLLTLGGCKKSTTTPPAPTPDAYEDLYKIGEKDIGSVGITLKLYMDEMPFMGYNYVYVVPIDNNTNEVLSNAFVSYLPMMDMGNMSHSSPLEQPLWNVDVKAHLGSITFIMPSVNGTWTIKVNVEHPVTHVTGEATFDVDVINKPEPKLFSFMSQVDNKKVFVALVEPRNPEVGLNDFNLAVYGKNGHTNFPPMSDLNIEIEPEMPTHGHGSPNNVNPTSVGYGLYHGTVNFTMTGYWKVNLKVKNNANEVMFDQGYFDITFQ